MSAGLKSQSSALRSPQDHGREELRRPPAVESRFEPNSLAVVAADGKMRQLCDAC